MTEWHVEEKLDRFVIDRESFEFYLAHLSLEIGVEEKISIIS